MMSQTSTPIRSWLLALWNTKIRLFYLSAFIFKPAILKFVYHLCSWMSAFGSFLQILCNITRCGFVSLINDTKSKRESKVEIAVHCCYSVTTMQLELVLQKYKQLKILFFPNEYTFI